MANCEMRSLTCRERQTFRGREPEDECTGRDEGGRRNSGRRSRDLFIGGISFIRWLVEGFVLFGRSKLWSNFAQRVESCPTHFNPDAETYTQLSGEFRRANLKVVYFNRCRFRLITCSIREVY